jgi:hypothetical protein
VKRIRKAGILYSALLLAISPVLLFGQASFQSLQSRDESHSPFAVIDQELADKAAESLASRVRLGLIPSTREVDNATERQLELKEASISGAASLQITGRQARLEQLKPLVVPILEQQGLPRELVAVISVESSGIPTALSPKGARGVWQLMPNTARRYGLIVDGIRDERLDIGRSTWAAARYLNDLYAQFGSWPLALAAYNTGEQNLERAIQRSQSNDFPVLSALGALPLETREYVPAVLAAWNAERGGSGVLEQRSLRSGKRVFALSGE